MSYDMRTVVECHNMHASIYLFIIIIHSFIQWLIDFFVEWMDGWTHSFIHSFIHTVIINHYKLVK